MKQKTLEELYALLDDIIEISKIYRIVVHQENITCYDKETCQIVFTKIHGESMEMNYALFEKTYKGLFSS